MTWDRYAAKNDCLLESRNWHLLMTYGQVPGGRRAIDVLAEHWSSESGGHCYSKLVRTAIPLCALLGEAFPGLGARHRANTDGIPLCSWECPDGTFMGQTDCSAYAPTIEDMLTGLAHPLGERSTLC